MRSTLIDCYNLFAQYLHSYLLPPEHLKLWVHDHDKDTVAFSQLSQLEDHQEVVQRIDSISLLAEEESQIGNQ